MIRSLKTKVIVAIFLILGVALALTGFLIRSKYETTYANLAQSRYDYVVRNLRTIIQTGFDLELSLGEMANLHTATERVLKTDKHILSVEIYAADGTILYRAGTGLRNRLIPDLWWRAPRLPKSRLWRVDDRNTLVVGSDVVGTIGTVVGGIALRAERTAVAKAASRLGNELRKIGTVIFLIGGLVAALLALGLLRGVLHALDRAIDALGGAPVGANASRTEILARETASNAAAILSAVDRASAGAATREANPVQDGSPPPGGAASRDDGAKGPGGSQ